MKSKINTFLGAVAATALTLPGSAAEKAEPKRPAREAAAFPSDSRANRAYQVEPYFGTAVDNTRRNVRDRAPEHVTPLDQGTGEADVDTTRRIRKEILSARELSVNARNIKVITVNGRVTLRGPVDNETEKRTLEEMAQRIAPTAKIDNQLEAKQQDR